MGPRFNGVEDVIVTAASGKVKIRFNGATL